MWVLNLVILGFALNPAMPLTRAEATAAASAQNGPGHQTMFKLLV